MRNAVADPSVSAASAGTAKIQAAFVLLISDLWPAHLRPLNPLES